MKHLLTIILLTIGLLSISQAQEIDTLYQDVISNAGEVLKSENYTLSFTIGEPVVGHLEVDGRQLTQGFQQPEQYEITSIGEPSSLRHNINIYPNPTKGVVTVELTAEQAGKLLFELYSMQGRELFSKRITGFETVFEIDLSAYPKGEYLLQVSDEKGTAPQVFQIIKI